MVRISSRSRTDIFIRELEAKKPSPGGGAAAALVGGLGIALMIKVANFTIGRKKYKRCEKEAKAILKVAVKLENKMTSLIERDAKAYRRYSETKSRAAMRNATLCVEEISRSSKKGLKICARLQKIGNLNLRGDLYAARKFLGASAEAADNLVKLNKKWTVR